MKLLWDYCEIALRLLWDYCGITVRLLWEYFKITARLLRDYCEITARLLQDYCEIAVRLLQDFFHIAARLIFWDYSRWPIHPLYLGPYWEQYCGEQTTFILLHGTCLNVRNKFKIIIIYCFYINLLERSYNLKGEERIEFSNNIRYFTFKEKRSTNV